MSTMHQSTVKVYTPCHSSPWRALTVSFPVQYFQPPSRTHTAIPRLPRQHQGTNQCPINYQTSRLYVSNPPYTFLSAPVSILAANRERSVPQ
jgi:hypothetical protein